MREISEKCYRCECYWQNCDTDTECEGMKEPCHEFRECKRLKWRARMNKQEIEKAISYIQNMDLSVFVDKDEACNVVDMITDLLQQQLTNRWIPVSERLPNFNDVCDITRNGVVIEDVIYQGINDGEDTWLVHSSSGDYKYIPVYSAIAWRNHIIPEPYKEVSHEA